jgi:hypothetical protein
LQFIEGKEHFCSKCAQLKKELIEEKKKTKVLIDLKVENERQNEELTKEKRRIEELGVKEVSCLRRQLRNHQEEIIDLKDKLHNRNGDMNSLHVQLTEVSKFFHIIYTLHFQI